MTIAIPTRTDEKTGYDPLIFSPAKGVMNMLFEDPKLNVIYFEVADILTVSDTEDDYSGPLVLPEIPA